METSITRRRRQELIIGTGLLIALALLPLPIHDVYTRNLIIITDRRAIGDSWLWLQFRIDKLPYHYAALAFAAVAWLVAWKIEGSRWGFVWRAVKDDPVAARSLAVRIFPSKMAAAAISGALTGIGGAI